ncbi:MAG: TAXI family TRAP transporter solute-binding subunit [Acidobacteriota bacterium]
MRTATLLTLLPLLLLSLTACQSTPSDDADSVVERQFLSIGTAPTGGAFFVVGGALAEVAAQFGPEGWEVTAEATKGSQENIRRLVRGELDFALANSAISYFAVRGEGGWDQTYPIKTVMTLAPNVALFVTPASSDIESIADLRGKRVVIGPAGAGFEYFVRPILDAHGVSWDDLNVLHNTQSAAADMLGDGSADAAFLGGAVPTASLVQAASSMELRFIPFDQEARDQLIADYPFFAAATIPAGTYRGLDDDLAVLDTGSMHLITNEKIPEDVVYAMTKTIYENRDAVVERHAAGKAIRPNVVTRDTGTPFHTGAQRFYEELGVGSYGEAADAGAAAAADTPAEDADAADADAPAEDVASES